jgi:hypothetical protein
MRNSLSTSPPGMTTQLVPRRGCDVHVVQRGKSRCTEELQVTQVDDQSVWEPRLRSTWSARSRALLASSSPSAATTSVVVLIEASGELGPLPWAVGFRLRAGL